MGDESRAELRSGIEALLRTAERGGDVYVIDSPGPRGDPDPPRIPTDRVTAVVAEWPESGLVPPRELSPEKAFALTVLLGEDDTTIANALADYLLDKGHEYATAVAEKARKEERERIAERLYSESAHVLSRSPDPNDMCEFAAAALSAVADDLVFDRPPTAPKTTE